MNSLVSRLPMDRRQIQSLHTVTRVSMQFIACAADSVGDFRAAGTVGDVSRGWPAPG